VSEWVAVAQLRDVPDGTLVGVSVQGVEAIVANTGGRYHCVGAVCPHAGCSLATDGELEGETVMCFCHGSAFDLNSGAVVRPPAEDGIDVYDVRIDGDAILVARRG
jgi:3-phenylpropionate/trans-cinnamate dioxygenase ferredoxin subunit